MQYEKVNHPKHYTSHPSGVECIQITEHMNFCLGNAIKYLWRTDLKNNDIEDLKKAIWYIQREIQLRINRRQNETGTHQESNSTLELGGQEARPLQQTGVAQVSRYPWRELDSCKED